MVRKNSNSIKILKKYIYSYKRNQDSLNIKKGNYMYMKNQYDRIKKFKSLDYININSLEIHLKIDFQDYNKLKNYELKNHIFHTLINYMIFFTNKTIIYKKINLVLNKLSEKKLILFYNCTNNKNLDAAFLTTFKALISSHKYIVPIFLNVSDKIKEINDFIFPSDTLIFLNNLFLNNQLYNFFD